MYSKYLSIFSIHLSYQVRYFLDFSGVKDITKLRTADRRKEKLNIAGKSFEEQGYGNLPICVAKTQYSFSTDPNLKGAPSGHVLPIREVRLSSGAEFIVVICGAIMTMPGLPRVPAADAIKLNNKGQIEGLF